MTLSHSKLMVVAFWAVLVASASVFAAGDHLTIETSGAMVLSAPAKVVGTVLVGDTLQVLAREKDWYKIRNRDGIAGWVAASWVKFLPGLPTNQAEVKKETTPPVAEKILPRTLHATRRVPLRAKANNKAKIVRWAEKGTKFTIVKDMGDWVQVLVSKKSTAFIYKTSTAFDEPSKSKDKVPPPETKTPLPPLPDEQESAKTISKSADPTYNEAEKSIRLEQSSTEPKQGTCTVLTDRALLRATPGGRMLGVLIKDTEGVCGPSQDGWTQFSLPNGMSGWIESTAVGPLAP